MKELLQEWINKNIKSLNTNKENYLKNLFNEIYKLENSEELINFLLENGIINDN